MIKVIVFDADGVLIRGNRKFSVRLADNYGISLDKTLKFYNGPFQDCLVGKKDLKEAISPYLADWGWNKGVDDFLDLWFQSEHNINEDFVEYVRKLRQSGVKCFLATNNEKYRFQYILDKMGFADVFDKTYSSAHLGHKKPDQNFFLKIFKELDRIQKNEILFIDDSIENINAAKDFGINAELYVSIKDFHEKIKQYML